MTPGNDQGRYKTRRAAIKSDSFHTKQHTERGSEAELLVKPGICRVPPTDKLLAIKSGSLFPNDSFIGRSVYKEGPRLSTGSFEKLTMAINASSQGALRRIRPIIGT